MLIAMFMSVVAILMGFIYNCAGMAISGKRIVNTSFQTDTRFCVVTKFILSVGSVELKPYFYSASAVPT